MDGAAAGVVAATTRRKSAVQKRFSFKHQGQQRAAHYRPRVFLNVIREKVSTSKFLGGALSLGPRLIFLSGFDV